jgi:hypothetical protein
MRGTKRLTFTHLRQLIVFITANEGAKEEHTDEDFHFQELNDSGGEKAGMCFSE